MPKTRLTLAVAGSRKTQGIIDACGQAPVGSRILILTYTLANQNELMSRLNKLNLSHIRVEVLGWFSFVIRHIVGPYVPYKFPDARVRGFDFDSPPKTGVSVDSYYRYFNKNQSVAKAHLPQLAVLVEKASGGQAMRRLTRLYDRIYIDEVQDLCGYDLEILSLLMRSDVQLNVVGDVRQAILATNGREAKNKKYMYMGIWDWFRKEETAGRLEILQSNQTWRCRPEIAEFADSLFGESWGFASTDSLNLTETEHDGVFLVRHTDVGAYIERYGPLFLRASKGSGRGLPFEFMNFGLSKGLSRERVLILPTQPISEFLKSGKRLTDSQSALLYVATTRAEQSVGFVLDDPGESEFAVWSP